MSDLVDTTEMYLRTILDLEEEDIVPLRARISERLGHSGPTVSQTIARMERDGLVRVEGNRHLELTYEGRRRATHVMRKHRLAERLLADVIGLDWAYVHDEACRWEHVMSEKVEIRLLEMLGHPTESPYGNPIPGLDELGDQPAGRFMEGVVRLLDFARSNEDGARAVVRRLGEPVQFDPHVLQELQSAGVVPGATVAITRSGTDVSLAVEGSEGALHLPFAIASHVYVAA